MAHLLAATHPDTENKRALAMTTSRIRNGVAAKTAAAISALLMAIAVMGAAAPSASAAGYSFDCYNFGSSDVCWVNYYDAYKISTSQTSTQYNRDQVCAKARTNYTTGPVEAGSACRNGVNFQRVAYLNPTNFKKAYGYWAGDGGGILVQVFGET